MARTSKEELKDGKILNELIQKFFNDPKIDTLYPVLLCLIDSDVHVPMNMIISDEDAEIMKNSKVGDEVSLKNDLRFRPDWLKSPKTEKLYFPIFSTVEEATEEYSKNFSWLNMDIDTCINFVEDNKDCSGLILNAFTTPIRIEDNLYKILKQTLEEVRRSEPIEIDEDNIKEIKYDGVIAMTIAEGGAMGEPNGFQVVDETMKLYHSNFVDGKVSYNDLKDAFPLLKTFKCEFDNVDSLDEGWKCTSLGMGNYLIIKEKYYENYMDRVKLDLGDNYRKVELYKNWFRLLQKVVLIKK